MLPAPTLSPMSPAALEVRFSSADRVQRGITVPVESHCSSSGGAILLPGTCCVRIVQCRRVLVQQRSRAMQEQTGSTAASSLIIYVLHAF